MQCLLKARGKARCKQNKTQHDGRRGAGGGLRAAGGGTAALLAAAARRAEAEVNFK